MSDNTGGLAFPLVGTHQHVIETGMTLRDYFAAKAMQALLNRTNRYDNLGHMETINVATNSFHMANTILAARKTKNE